MRNTTYVFDDGFTTTSYAEMRAYSDKQIVERGNAHYIVRLVEEPEPDVVLKPKQAAARRTC